MKELFNYDGTLHREAPSFHLQWMGVLERHKEGQVGWAAHFEPADRRLDVMRVLATVNTRFNGYRYRRDQGRDQWATPFEFLTKKGGDCEDFATIKRFALVEFFDFDPRRLEMVVVTDTKSGNLHAVLVAEGTDGLYVLDNQNTMVLPEPVHVPRYHPIFGFGTDEEGQDCWTRYVRRG